MRKVFVDGIGVLGPGLPGWLQSRTTLSGSMPFEMAAIAVPAVAALPPAERRRTGIAVRLAIAAGLDALADAGHDPASMTTVFTSSGGDGDTIDAILNVLATDQREISPTRFHNSVHNAPSGYWALACGAMAPSTSLCGFDGSFATGLLDAAAQCGVEGVPVTLISYDLPYPGALHMARPITTQFATSLVLTPEQTPHSIASLQICLAHGNATGTPMDDPTLEALRQSNPAARSLPLLAALAVGDGFVAIEGIANAVVEIEVGRP